ncbi:SPOR domain-containing protein [Jiella avicenniae]|nr:SPOR domain-containing protein [Jiella avicenniae]
MPAPAKTAAAPAVPAAAAAPKTGQPAGDFDREFEQALLGLSEPANPRQATFHHAEAFAPAREPAVADDGADARIFDDFDELIASELAAIKQDAPREAAFSQAVDTDAPLESPEWPAAFEAPTRAAKDPEADDSFDEEDMRATRRMAAVAGRGSAARSSFVGAGIGAIALMLAAGGAYYFLGGSQGTTGDGSVLIVRADQDPVKVKPENPGGREIPNQNKMVYSRVEDGDAIVTPQQKQLVSAEETPIDLPREEAPISDLPGVEIGVGAANAAEPMQSADASGQSADTYSEASAISVLSPRRAKTYSVRPDGTLVVGEAVEDDRGPLIQAAARPLDAAREIGTSPAGQGVANETVSAIAAAGEDTMAGAAEQGADAAIATTATTDEPGVPAPNVPVPTLRPRADGETSRVAATAPAPADPAQPAAATPQPEPVQTASLQPEPAAPSVSAAPSHDGYYVQISSQPSQDAAQASSRNLSQRYSSVIAGRNVVIQSADIPGKGTYYRVRVPVDSKSEGVSLCGDLKSAGGSCFVSR